LISAIASVIDAETPEEIDAILDTLPDPAGYFYRFGLARSLMHRKRLQREDGHSHTVEIDFIPKLDPELAE
jgi:hypothetical protein